MILAIFAQIYAIRKRPDDQDLDCAGRQFAESRTKPIMKRCRSNRQQQAVLKVFVIAEFVKSHRGNTGYDDRLAIRAKALGARMTKKRSSLIPKHAQAFQIAVIALPVWGPGQATAPC
jgi:hypothetical protein